MALRNPIEFLTFTKSWNLNEIYFFLSVNESLERFGGCVRGSFRGGRLCLRSPPAAQEPADADPGAEQEAGYPDQVRQGPHHRLPWIRQQSVLGHHCRAALENWCGGGLSLLHQAPHVGLGQACCWGLGWRCWSGRTRKEIGNRWLLSVFTFTGIGLWDLGFGCLLHRSRTCGVNWDPWY